MHRKPARPTDWHQHVVPVLTAVLESSTDAILVLRAVRDQDADIVDFEIMMVNAPAEQLLYPSAGDLIGTRLSQIVRNIPPERLGRYVNAVETGTSATSRIQLPGLGDRWLDVNATGFSNQGMVAIFRDVTDQQRHTALVQGMHQRQEVLERQALTDPLTGLGNRLLVESRLEHAMSRLDRTDTSVAVVYIDLDGLKPINDAYGHAAGDAVLIEFGRRLLAVTRPYDTIGRIGGDEFVMVCEDLDNTYDIDRIARRFLQLCADPVSFVDGQLRVAASVGVAVADSTDTDAAALLREADTAMYRAKSKGGGRIEYFDTELHELLLARYEIRSGLTDAIERHALEIDFDVVVGPDRQTVALRAAAGWTHPEHGFIDERALFEAASRTGAASGLTAWVLGHALTVAEPWLNTPTGQLKKFVVVNVDGKVLHDVGFAELVVQALDRHRVDPQSLCIAVDGIYLAAHNAAVKSVLDHLAGLGVRIARNGVTASGSLHAHLRELPIAIVILDAALTNDLCETDIDLLGVVIDTAKVEGRLVMALSTSPTQFDTLTALGADLVQI